MIQKARIVFSEFDIIGVGTVGEDTLMCFNPPLNKMEHWGRNKKLMEDSFENYIYQIDSDSDEDFDNLNNDYYQEYCVCGTGRSSFYALQNRVTSKRVCPIGCVCIWKIADPDTAQILTESNKIIEKYNVTKEKRRVLKEKKRIREELRLMRLEDKHKKTNKKRKCDSDCPCFELRELNKKQLDPLLFNIKQINTKQYIYDMMLAMQIEHKFV